MPFCRASAARATGASTSEFVHTSAAGRAVFLYEELTLHALTPGNGPVAPVHEVLSRYVMCLSSMFDVRSQLSQGLQFYDVSEGRFL
mgnify:CR=1 FL=1